MKILIVVLLAIKCSSIVSKYQGMDVISTVKQINSKFSTETNVFFDFDDFFESKHLQSLNIPSVIITQSVNFQFIYALDKDILVVAGISQYTSTEIQKRLNHVLHRIHHVNMLFVLLDSADCHLIFDWAWKNGYKNSIALYWIKNRKFLAEFQPFPDLQQVNLDSINETKLQEPITNFHQKPLRTPMANDPPRSFRYVNRQGKLIYSGLFLKLFVLFIEHYNASIEEVFLPEPYPNGLLIPDMIKALKEGKIDISPHPFLQLYDEYLCTYAFVLAFFYLMVPHSRQVDQFLYFVLPFDAHTWTAITATIFLFAVGIFLRSKAARGQYEFGHSLLQAFSGILNISFTFRTYKSKMLVFIYILLLVVGIMLSNMYLAQLSTFLTTLAYEKQINSVEDVIASKLPITIAKYDKEVYERIGAPAEIMKKVVTIDLEEWHHQRRILNTSRIDIISSEKYLFFAHQQLHLKTPRVKKIDKPLMGLAPAFALPFTSPYVSLYSDFFQRTIESGIYRKTIDNLNSDGIATGMIEFLVPDVPELVPLTLQHFKISLFLLGGGFIISALCFFIEIVLHKFKI